MLRFLLALLMAATLATGALAQSKPFKVTLILFRGMTPAEQGFMDQLKARLPVEFTVRNVQGSRALIREFVEEARRDRPDLLYTFGTTVTLDTVGAVGQVDPGRHITDIPVIFNIVADPVGARLADALAATGRNLTGVSHLVPMPDQLRVMQRFKQVKKLGVIFNPYEPNSALAVEQLKGLTGQFQFALTESALQTAPGRQPVAQDVVDAMQRLIATKPDFIYLPSDSSLIARASIIMGLATGARIPVISATEGPIRDDAALVGLVSNYYNAGAFAAHKAEQILVDKQSVGRLPIETLRRFALVVNMTTAIQLGIYPPLDLIRIAELL
ncbi:MAG: ABC transporter substrate-binding protein [Xanthobacteraceae bacterium]|nr:ABC transporter substrate-binding protein [Xanthobacteraceae bacterium]